MCFRVCRTAKFYPYPALVRWLRRCSPFVLPHLTPVPPDVWFGPTSARLAPIRRRPVFGPDSCPRRVAILPLASDLERGGLANGTSRACRLCLGTGCARPVV